jgi:hypothetical protein
MAAHVPHLTVSLAMVMLMLMASGGRALQPPATTEQQYVLLDAEQSRSRFVRTVNVSRTGDRLREVAEQGYTLQLMSASSRSLNMLLKRVAGPSVEHRLVAESSEGALVAGLNKGAVEDFRVVAGSIKALDETSMGSTQTTWVAVLAKGSPTRVTYSVVKGRKKAESALSDSSTSGRALVGVVGRQGMTGANIVLFFEQTQGPAHESPEPHAEYRILSAARTSAMQNDLAGAAAQGFRVIAAGSGYMTAVMARDPRAAIQPLEYRLLATQRVATSVKELQAAGAEGFRVVATTEHGPEVVFIAERTPGARERYRYEIVTLQADNADKTLREAEGDGYRVVRLLDDLALLEGAVK